MLIYSNQKLSPGNALKAHANSARLTTKASYVSSKLNEISDLPSLK